MSFSSWASYGLVFRPLMMAGSGKDFQPDRFQLSLISYKHNFARHMHLVAYHTQSCRPTRPITPALLLRLDRSQLALR